MSSKSPFIKEWCEHQVSIIKRVYPEVKEKDIKKFVKEQAESKFINRDVAIHNNYFHVKRQMTLLEVVEWIRDKQPLMAGFGMFYKNQEQSINPNAHMLMQFIKLRKEFKNQLHELQEGTYSYMTADRQQLTEKVNANSFYGCNGAKVSRFFNLYTASSVTLTGQSLNSTSGQAFEAFLKNAVKFYDLDNCFEYLENIRKESYKGADFSILPFITVTQVLERLKGMFYEYNDSYEYPIFRYLMSLNQKKLQAIYFKNNLYEFTKIPVIEEATIRVLREIDNFRDKDKIPKKILDLVDLDSYESTTDVPAKVDGVEVRDSIVVTFKNPNVVPVEVKDELSDLWQLYRTFVFYNYSPIDRIHRMKNAPRKVVPMADTDSNFLHLDPWVQHIESLIEADEELSAKDPTEMWFASINIMCFYLTKMINEVLWKYTTSCNVPEKYRSGINMKNEYLYSKLYTTDKKKRYIGSIRLREGTEIYPEKLDIKGWKQPLMLAIA